MRYAPEGFPSRIEGKKAIRRQYGILLTEYKSIRIPDRILHFTNDSNRVWVEFRGEIQIKATGKFHNSTYVCLFTLRDGRIIEYKEYSNPLILKNSFGSPKAPRKKVGPSSKNQS
jgi:ketosteroid isomerase-like protein